MAFKCKCIWTFSNHPISQLAGEKKIEVGMQLTFSFHQINFKLTTFNLRWDCIDKTFELQPSPSSKVVSQVYGTEELLKEPKNLIQ